MRMYLVGAILVKQKWSKNMVKREHNGQTQVRVQIRAVERERSNEVVKRKWSNESGQTKVVKRRRSSESDRTKRSNDSGRTMPIGQGCGGW